MRLSEKLDLMSDVGVEAITLEDVDQLPVTQFFAEQNELFCKTE